MTAMWQAARFAVKRRKMQTFIIGMVLMLSTGTVVLALGLLVTANGPFDRAFAQYKGAHLTVTYDAAKGGDVKASASRPGVLAAGGPYASKILTIKQAADGFFPSAPLTVVERSPSPDDQVDVLFLEAGRWATAPGEIALMGPDFLLGKQMTFTDGSSFTVVGVGQSFTDTAQAWVVPGQLVQPVDLQMVYRLADPSAAAETVAAGLPMTSDQSYLAARIEATESAKTAIPFLIAFGIAGLLVAVLIIANVVSGAVVSGYRHIGVLKALGFTPNQVTGVYLVMVAMPGALGSLVGVAVGNALAGALSSALGGSLGLPSASGVSVTVDVLAFLGVLAVIAITALVPAVRAGRIPAAVAVSAGAAPSRGRALRVQRALARTRLPRPVSLGFGLPFARPGRTALTLSAVAFGVAAVTFSAGLDRTISTYVEDDNRSGEFQVEVYGAVPSLAQRPGTAKVATAKLEEVHVPGVSRGVEVKAYEGSVTDRHGYRMAEGRWLAGPGEAVVGGPFLRATGKKVGDIVHLSKDGRKATLKIVGVGILDDALITDEKSFDAFSPGAKGSISEITLAPGTSADSYAAALQAEGVHAEISGGGGEDRVILLGLIGTLTLGITIVAALGVFNTVVLNTRDRARDFGILKSLGATPTQVLTVVLASMAALGLIGGLIGLPLGIAAQQIVAPLMADAGGVILPYGLSEIFPWPAMVLFVVAGVAIAVLGAVIPAGWAARIKTAAALRSELSARPGTGRPEQRDLGCGHVLLEVRQGDPAGCQGPRELTRSRAQRPTGCSGRPRPWRRSVLRRTGRHPRCQGQEPYQALAQRPSLGATARARRLGRRTPWRFRACGPPWTSHPGQERLKRVLDQGLSSVTVSDAST